MCLDKPENRKKTKTNQKNYDWNVISQRTIRNVCYKYEINLVKYWKNVHEKRFQGFLNIILRVQCTKIRVIGAKTRLIFASKKKN